MPVPGGRPQSSSVHRYFKKLDGSKASCEIEDNDGNICGLVVSGAYFSTNLKYHLDKCHPAIGAEVRSADKNRLELLRKKKTVDDRQQTLQDCFNSRKPYQKTSSEYAKKSMALALFLGGTNAPISMVENPLFRNLVTTLDTRFLNFGRKKATRLVANLRSELSKKIAELLLEAKRVSVTTDLWTKKDQTPFIGVTAHFFCRKDHRRYNIVIALRELPHPHTGESIYDKMIEILMGWDVSIDKVFRIITDNASNMIKAFDSPEQELDPTPCTDEEITDSENEDNDVASGGDLTSGGELTSGGDLESDDEESDNEGNLSYFAGQFGLEEEAASIIADDENEFDILQDEHQSIWGRKHGRCVVHSLQLVVRKFENDGPSKSVLKAAIALVRKFRKSSKLTQQLKKLGSGKILRAHCATRWSSLYRMIDRLLELETEITAVCSYKKNKVDGLRHSQWKHLRCIHQLLEPFAAHTATLEAYNSTAVSMVLPALYDLQYHLQKMISDRICTAAAALLQTELTKRFDHFLNTDSHRLDPIFIVATAVDPRYKWVLNEKQKQCAADTLLVELRDSLQNVMEQDQEVCLKTGSKRFKSLISSERNTVAKPATALEDEISTYIHNDSIRLDEDSDPLNYWQTCSAYPTIADFAMDLLVMPCSSSASESLFSHAGFLCSDMKSRVSVTNLENQVLLKTNYKLFL